MEVCIVDVQKCEVWGLLSDSDARRGDRGNGDDDDCQEGCYCCEDRVVSSLVVFDPCGVGHFRLRFHASFASMKGPGCNSRICPNLFGAAVVVQGLLGEDFDFPVGTFVVRGAVQTRRGSV